MMNIDKEKMMNTDIYDLTIGQAKQLNSMFGANVKKEICLPFEVGGKYFIRTVTYALSGKVCAIVGKFLILTDAAWIADTGRFYDALKNSKFDEVEPFQDNVFVNVESITDATEIKILPREQS